MAAIRTEEITFSIPANLQVIPGGRQDPVKLPGWHPSLGPRAESHVNGDKITNHECDRRPNYALRRLVVGLAAITLLTGVSWGVGTLAFSAPPISAGSEYVVKPGDTLWSIAQNHSPDSDPRRIVEAIRSLNDIGPEIRPGQQIVLPA